MAKDIGASGKVLEIDLGATAPPFEFETVFEAAYSGTGLRRFVSRALVALDGPGTLTVIDGEGHLVTLTLENREVVEMETTGIIANSGVTKVRVML